MKKRRGILSAEVSAGDRGWYVRSGGRPPLRYVHNGRCLKEKSLFEEITEMLAFIYHTIQV